MKVFFSNVLGPHQDSCCSLALLLSHSNNRIAPSMCQGASTMDKKASPFLEPLTTKFEIWEVEVEGEQVKNIHPL